MATSDPRVLVVEDDADVREVLTDILAAYGYFVLTAASGADGLRVLRSEPQPDVVLLDLMMPGINGYDFLTERQRDAVLSEVPVIVLTADRTAQSRVAELGATHFLNKPPQLEELLAAVARYCSPSCSAVQSSSL